MATKITQQEMRNLAKAQALEKLRGVLDEMDAVWVGTDAYVSTEVDGTEIWVGVEIKAKQWTKTQRSDPFDPFEALENYEFEQKVKAEERKRKAEEKAKAEAKRKAKAEAEKKG